MQSISAFLCCLQAAEALPTWGMSAAYNLASQGEILTSCEAVHRTQFPNFNAALTLHTHPAFFDSKEAGLRLLTLFFCVCRRC
ncbi:hypothetical protein D5018_21185 [Parashewanella curva]|uniref:Uncharacterized protein n=1 Tax=Parashewanella curva TaxID=2338552 RepID=A0A3L8PQP0_9GAMM|nr:hypothetical protein D5018_21185 [Parashewanella curva]